MTTIILIVIAMTGLSLSTAESNWDQEARDFILKFHNDRRAEENACNMNKMVYNMTLEAEAKTWAEGCVFAHEMKRGRGENLAYTPIKNKGLIWLVNFTANLWQAEREFYNLEENRCSKVCGHYTQIVWSKTTDVGCYSTRCDFGYYLVCFYYPQGNMNKRPPFTRDCRDEKCLEGTTYEEGLCYSEAECPNKKKHCNTWYVLGFCENRNYKRYMQINCQKVCKSCSNPNDDLF